MNDEFNIEITARDEETGEADASIVFNLLLQLHPDSYENPTNYVVRNLRPMRHRQHNPHIRIPPEDVEFFTSLFIWQYLLNRHHQADANHLQGQPPASSAAISMLQVLTSLSDKRINKHKRCAICLDEFTPATSEHSSSQVTNNYIRMPCHHVFHEECISTWLKTSCTCPSCRYEILTENPEYNVGITERMKARDDTLRTEADTDAETDVEEVPIANLIAKKRQKRKRAETIAADTSKIATDDTNRTDKKPRASLKDTTTSAVPSSSRSTSGAQTNSIQPSSAPNGRYNFRSSDR